MSKRSREASEERAARVQAAGFWALALLATVLSFTTLGRLPLMGFSEGRYGAIASEMFTSGDWTTPRYSGIEHFEKPPLVYWLSSLCYSSMGLDETAARVPAAVAGLILLALTMLIAHRLIGTRGALLSGLILATCPLWVMLSRSIMTDMVLAAGTTTYVMASLAVARAGPGGRRWAWVILSGVGLATAILTKFHLVLLLGTAPLVVESLRTRDRRLLFAALHPVSWSIGVGALLPWALAILRANPGIVEWVWDYQTQKRLFSTVHDREAPFYSYIPWLVFAAAPWILFIGAAIERLRGRRRGGRITDDPRPERLVFLWIWFLLPVVVFSFIGSKRINYLPPILPPLAILLAEFLLAGRTRYVGGLLVFWSRALLWIPALATFLPAFGLRLSGGQPLPTAVGWAGAAFLVSAIVFEISSARARRRARRDPGTSVPATAIRFGMCLLLAFALAIGPAMTAVTSIGSRLNTHAYAAQAALPFAKRDVPIVSYHLETASLTFYTEGRPAILVGVPRQVHFESAETLRDRYFPDDSDEEKRRFERLLASSAELVIITKHKYLPHLEKRVGHELERIYVGHHYVVARLARQ